MLGNLTVGISRRPLEFTFTKPGGLHRPHGGISRYADIRSKRARPLHICAASALDDRTIGVNNHRRPALACDGATVRADLELGRLATQYSSIAGKFIAMAQRAPGLNHRV